MQAFLVVKVEINSFKPSKPFPHSSSAIRLLSKQSIVCLLFAWYFCLSSRRKASSTYNALCFLSYSRGYKTDKNQYILTDLLSKYGWNVIFLNKNTSMVSNHPDIFRMIENKWHILKQMTCPNTIYQKLAWTFWRTQYSENPYIIYFICLFLF